MFRILVFFKKKARFSGSGIWGYWLDWAGSG
jgi:hypothetical protein